MPMAWRCFTGAVALGLSLGAAQAATVDISGSGYFDTGTITTPASLAGHTFSFSFMAENPTVGTGIADSDIFNTSFSLSAVPISTKIDSVTFQDIGRGGLFDLNFHDGTILSFYGNYAIDINGLLQPGPYGATVGVDRNPPAGTMSFGLVAVSVDVAPVPLPNAALLFGSALLGLGMVTAKLVRKVEAPALS